jgi:DNA-binding response OmpR family regulator
MKTVLDLGNQERILENNVDYFNKEDNLRTESEKNNSYLQKPQLFKRIVIIDDEAKIRTLFSRVLSKAGYETITFGDNVHAIKYLGNGENYIDLLVLDLDMPHVDGHYFCKMIRMKHPLAKILIASNYALDVQKYLICDADDYHDKSDGNDVLLTKITNILREKDKLFNKGGTK